MIYCLLTKTRYYGRLQKASVKLHETTKRNKVAHMKKKPQKQDKTTPRSIRFPNDLWESLQVLAKKNHRYPSSEVIDRLEKSIGKETL